MLASPTTTTTVDFVPNPKLESTSFSMIYNIPQLLQMHKDDRGPIPDLNLVFIIMWLYTSLTIFKTVTTGNESGVGSRTHLIVNTKRWFIRVCHNSKVIKS